MVYIRRRNGGGSALTAAVAAILATLSTAASADANATSGSPCEPWGERGTAFPAAGRRTISVADPGRGGRALTVDVWYPAEDGGESLTSYNPYLPSEGHYVALDDPIVASPNDDDGFPLLVFSHGSGGIRQQSARLMEHLASWGFVVASPDHAGNSANDPPGSNISVTILDRPMDVSFVVDSMLTSPYVDEFHLQKSVERGVGVLGHSFGGLTSLMVAPDGESSDDRVKAILPISPSVWRASENDGLSKITVPTLAMGGQNDTWTPVDPNNILVFQNTSGLPRWNIVVSDAGHNSFTDLCFFYNSLMSVFGNDNEDTVYSLLGGGDAELGKERMDQSFCESYETAQSILGYYAASFFSMVLLSGNDEAGAERRREIKQCMAEQRHEFPLRISTFDFLDDNNGDDETTTESGTNAPTLGEDVKPPSIAASTEAPTSSPAQLPTSIEKKGEEKEDGNADGTVSSAAFSVNVWVATTPMLLILSLTHHCAS